MISVWIGELVGDMHRHKISKKRLSEELGLTKEYISAILNGHRSPPGIEKRMRDALDRIIEKEENIAARKN